MPELPEVETVKNAVQKAIGLANITDVIIKQNHFREVMPEDFREKLVGAQIIKYERIAKYLVIHLSNGYAIIWHLGMSGRIKICEDMPEQLEKHDHVVIKTTNGILIYHDPRRFGLLTCCPSTKLREANCLKHTGIDPVTEKWDGSYLAQKFKNKKIPVKVALLDQAIVAGIGNIYASEALFAAGISPLREAGSLKPKEYQKLAEAIKATLQKAIEAGGSTLRDYRKPDGSEGYFQHLHCVYNKTGQQCPNCTCNIAQTGGIKKIVQAGRSSFYCPTKQK